MFNLANIGMDLYKKKLYKLKIKHLKYIQKKKQNCTNTKQYQQFHVLFKFNSILWQFLYSKVNLQFFFIRNWQKRLHY